MSIHVTCDHCGAGFSVKDEHAGRRGKCKKCGEPVVVPEIEVEPEPEGLIETDGSGEVLEDESSQVPIAALGAAVVAAVLGSVAWAAMIYFTEYEIGYLAWGIGGAVGFGAIKMGGRGIAMGIVAAALTVVSIFGGKFVSNYVMLSKYFDEALPAAFNRELYEETKQDARDLAELSDRSDKMLSVFMLSHGYTDEVSQGEVSAEQIEDFRTGNIPWLEMIADEQPSFKVWQPRAIERATGSVERKMTEIVIETIVEDGDVIDLIFLGLGVATAFGMCTRGRAD